MGGQCPYCSFEHELGFITCPECGRRVPLVAAPAPEDIAQVHTLGGAPLVGAAPPRAGVRTGEPWLDWIGQGALPVGCVALLAGDPGAGKSTVALLLAAAWAREQPQGAVAYWAAEQGVAAVFTLAHALQVSSPAIRVYGEPPVPSSLPQPRLLIIDSTQATSFPDAPAGSAAAARWTYEVARGFAGETRNPRSAALAVLLCHVTKDEHVAGPRTMEHLVDVVLWLRKDDEERRWVRATKNRFGPCREAEVPWPWPRGRE